MAFVRRTSELPIPAREARRLAQRLELFAFVVAPYLQIRGIDAPGELEAGTSGSGRLWWFGLLPSWRHEIELDDGWHAAPTRLFARLMFRHRHRRWSVLAGILRD